MGMAVEIVGLRDTVAMPVRMLVATLANDCLREIVAMSAAAVWVVVVVVLGEFMPANA